MTETKRLVIANRGEIARRIQRSARARGYRVAVVSTSADRDSLIRSEADDVLEVPSFLDAEAIVDEAKLYRASCLHPGYGFLSENAAFAERVEAAGIAFVGPDSVAMRAAGDKQSAKRLAAKCDVPTLAALFSEELEGRDDDELRDALASKGIDSPFLVKAAGGGGGRGMRSASTIPELRNAITRASDEAQAGFGDSTVFIERFLESPRHIEIQIFGDGVGGGVALGERDCSVQRRHQKVIEQAPSPGISAKQRLSMGRAALRLVAETNYRGAGTVEFLLDGDGRFFFLEMNTRLQVEHPVTEAVFGIDLVDCQLSLAEGEWPACLPDPASAHVVEPRGCAIEVRVLAEDPRNDFFPTPGPLLRYREPRGVGVRVDSGVRQGDRVNPEFDSMIAKVIVLGANRAQAIRRLDRAVESMVIVGATTNLPLLRAIVRHPTFQNGELTTEWLGVELDSLNQSLVPETLARRLTSSRFLERLSRRLVSGNFNGSLPEAASRYMGLSSSALRVGSAREFARIEIEGPDRSGAFAVSGAGILQSLREADACSRYSSRLRRGIEAARRSPNGSQSTSAGVPPESDRPRLRLWAAATDEFELVFQVAGEVFRVPDPRRRMPRRSGAATGDDAIRAPMAGKVVEVRVAEGDRVTAGEVLFVVESMKMQLEVRAPGDVLVGRVLVEVGHVLDGPELLAECTPVD